MANVISHTMTREHAPSRRPCHVHIRKPTSDYSGDDGALNFVEVRAIFRVRGFVKSTHLEPPDVCAPVLADLPHNLFGPHARAAIMARLPEQPDLTVGAVDRGRRHRPRSQPASREALMLPSESHRDDNMTLTSADTILMCSVASPWGSTFPLHMRCNESRPSVSTLGQSPPDGSAPKPRLLKES